MCGICGIVAREPVDERVLHAMAASLTSRGPDDEGYYLGQNAGLGHRRLSIIDLTGGLTRSCWSNAPKLDALKSESTVQRNNG